MKQKLLYIILMILCTFAWSGEAWGDTWDQWVGKSGSGTKQGSTWYVWYDNNEYSVGVGIGIETSREHDLSGPGTTLSFEAKRSATGIGTLKVDKYVNGGYTNIYDQNPGKVEKKIFGIESQIGYVSYGTYDVKGATKLKFYESGASYQKFYKNIRVPMAQYIIEPSTTSSLTTISFGSGKVDETVTRNFTIYWCNVPAMTTSVTGTNKDDVEVTITNNSEAGKYNTATVNVKYKRKLAGNLNATLTVSNTYGTYSKSITLTGSATKYDQTLSWNNTGTISTNLKVNDTQELPATASSGLSVTYVSSNTNVLTVNSNGLVSAVGEGSATITASQSGNYKYNAASSITKSFTVKKNANTLTVLGNQELKVGQTKSGVYSNVNSIADVLCEISGTVYTDQAHNNGTGVISYDVTSNTITALNAGTANLKIYQEPNTAYEGVEKTLTVTVTKNSHELQWVDNDLDLNLVLGATGISSAASVTSGKTITYTSSNSKALEIASDGSITTKGIGQSTVTASVPVDYKYNAETIERTFNVDVTKQASFKPNWEGGGTSTSIELEHSTTITLQNAATDGTFTFESSTPGVILCTRSDDGKTLTIEGKVAGVTTLTLKQIGNPYLVGAEVPFTITVTRHPNTFALSDNDLTLELDAESGTIVTNSGNNNTQVSYDPAGIATYDATNNKIEAKAVGTTVITFTQAPTDEYEGTSIDLNVTVTKKANTLKISPFSLDMEVDGSIELETSDKNNPSAITANITDTQLSPTSTVNKGTEVISFANGVITAKNAGTAKIKFLQAATDEYEGFESSVYEITVSKRSNAITVKLDGEQKNSKNIAQGDHVTLDYSSDSDGAFSVALTSGSTSIANLSGNTITAGNTDDANGVNIWTITQAETYKYKSATATVRIKVNSVAEEEGYVCTGWTGDGEEYSWSTISSTDALKLNGPAEFFTFQAKATDIIGFWNSKEFYAEYSMDNGGSWQKATIIGTNSTNINIPQKDTWYSFSCEIPENATHVRLKTYTDATGKKHVRNLRVSRRTYIRATATKTNLEEIYTDKTSSTTFTVDYSTTNGGEIEILSYNSCFTVSPASIPVSKNSDNRGNPQTVTVTYTPNPDKLSDQGTISISDLFNSDELIFTASAKKYDTTIERGSNTETAMSVYGSIDNAFAFTGTSAAYPSDSSSDDFYYSITNNPSTVDVISYDPANNTITGLNGGTATLTIYQKKTNLYHATSQSFDFTVNKLQNNVIIALNPTTLNVDGSTTVQLSNDMSEGALSASFSDIVYTNSSLNRDGGILTFDPSTNTLTGWNAGEATVTITQAETSKYLAKSQQFTVKVNKLNQTLSWDDPYLETSLQKEAVVSGNTAKSNVGLTPVTYASGNTECITVNSSTGVLTAVGTGTSIITASQAGNYKYNSATLTRQFSVFNKQTPAFVTDSHFTGTNGRVELEGTATITVTGVSTGSDFSISGYDNTVISVVHSGETVTITGLKLGTTTLTLEQEGNDDFIAKTQTYNIEVYWPDDFLALSPTVEPDYAAKTYRKVFFNRSLKADYSTLSLPFNTTVQNIVGTGYNAANDWVAQLSVVTYNAKDGYSLYFQKSNEIVANQPYILHLGSEVNSPVFTNISVVAAEEGSQSPTKGVNADQWILHANYDPTFDMNGYYGVVGEKIKKGTTGSTLKAYHAYIVGPASAAVKAAYLDEDEADGLLELIRSEQDEVAGQQIYDLQGRKLSREQRGINIVVRRDGKVTKVLSTF